MQGTVLVLSDGRDTSGDSVNATLKAAKASDARVDVVSLDQSGATLDTLTSIADAGGGEVTNADDPAALEALFEEQARVLSSQLLVSFDVPSGWEGGDATLDVAVDAGDETYTDSAFVAPAGEHRRQGSLDGREAAARRRAAVRRHPADDDRRPGRDRDRPRAWWSP